MKILHLGTTDIAGGAARASFRLHWALRKQGYDSTVLVARRYSNDPTVTAIVKSMDVTTRVQRYLRWRQILRDFSRYHATRPTGLEPFSDDRSVHAFDFVKQLPPCDVIYLHWVAGFVDYHSFFSALPRRTRVVWVLHDMNVMTGGCHYDNDCGRYKSGCGACPQLGSADPKDLSRQIWKRKQEVFGMLEANRLHLVAPSHWMLELVKGSPLLSQFPVTMIPNGVDLEEFAPRDRGFARELRAFPKEHRSSCLSLTAS